MNQNEKQVLLYIGGRTLPDEGADALDRGRHGHEAELISLGYKLVLGVVMGVIVIIGTLFDALESFKSPGRRLEVLMLGRPPVIPLHEWYVGENDGDTP